jgi:zinc/manganese transport system substrate-binding protein
MLHRTASPHVTGRAGRLVALLGAVALVAACGSGDSATTETTAASETTSATIAPETTAAPTLPETTAAPSTTTTTIDERPVVVVTYSILGDIVSRLVGDAARVEVVVPDGSDPHEFSASAQDIERMMSAALVVANGLNLEEGLSDALGQVAAANVALFEAAAHITVRELAKDGDDHDHDHDHGHDHEGGDPHLWTSAAAMAEMVPALTDALEAALAVDLAAEEAEVLTALTALDSEVQAIIDRIPAGGCKLVTGHESLGYFADRYGCELIGAVIPSLSSTAEASAKELAELQQVAAEAGVGAIFTEAGTPADVAEQVAAAVGVPLVELPSHDLPDDGGYEAFLTELATRIADALA